MASAMKPLQQLKEELVQCIDQIQRHLDSQSQPGPSLDRSSPPVFILSNALDPTRAKALQALHDLETLLRGPVPQLLHTTTSQLFMHGALYSVGHFGIAEKLEEEEQIGFAELAGRCNVKAIDSFQRVLRVAISHHIFEEPRPGFICHNALSMALRRQPILGRFISHCYEDILPAQTKLPEALEKWPSTEDPRETAFALANGGGVSAFELINGDPARAQRFADSMTVLQSNPAYAIHHIVDNFDWQAAKAPLIVDVGGSSGVLVAALLHKNPNASGIVQDVPDVVNQAVVPSGLEGRLRFQAQDFFQPQQATGADIYLFRWIFHDWPDSSVVKILSNLVPALKPGARLVICEMCLPEPGTVEILEDQRVRGFDLGMRVLFNGKERDETEWRDVLKRADSRFVLKSVRTPRASQLSIIEVLWTGS